MAEYAGRVPLFHLDLFRLRDETDVFQGGLIDDRRVGQFQAVEHHRVAHALHQDLEDRLSHHGVPVVAVGASPAAP